MTLPRLLSGFGLAAALALSGCSPEEQPVAPPPPPVDESAVPGVYGGTFPCSDCPGVAHRLWLRTDGVFFLRQIYLEAESDESAPFYALGRWRVDPATQLLMLEGDGPPRRFNVNDADTLEFQTSSRPAHILRRDPDGTSFADLITVEGDYTPGKTQYFAECKTGLRYPIANSKEARKLRRQYRSMPRGQAILAVLETHLETSEESQLWVVDRIVSLKPDERCAP